MKPSSLSFFVVIVAFLTFSILLSPLAALGHGPSKRPTVDKTPELKSKHKGMPPRKTPRSKKAVSSKEAHKPRAQVKSSRKIRSKKQLSKKSSVKAYSKRKQPTKRSPVKTYKAAIVMNAKTGEVLFKENPHQKLLPASLTKMMVTLVAMEKVKQGSIRLEDKVRVSKQASGVGGSQIYLRPGETLTLEGLLKAVQIRSANDAAAAVAEHISGTQEKFVHLMNARARKLGMKDTLFRNVHGLPSKDGRDNISSAYDMAILARELIKYPQVLRWSSKPTAKIRNGRYEIANTNKLLRSYSGLDGLKTGYSRRAGFNLAATAERNDRRLIAVTMGSPSSEARFNAAKNLLSKGFSQYEGKLTASKKSFRKPVKGVVNTKTGRLNVRKGAGKNFKVIDNLKKGKQVRVLESSHGWYKLKLSDVLDTPPHVLLKLREKHSLLL